jgi:hypothetical protein
MARKLRIQYPGAIYHVMNRGDHQEMIFGDDEDRTLLVTVGWIARRLVMGTRGHLAHLLYRNAESPSDPSHANQPSLRI